MDGLDAARARRCSLEVGSAGDGRAAQGQSAHRAGLGPTARDKKQSAVNAGTRARDNGNSNQEATRAAKHSSIQLLFQGCKHAPTVTWRCEMKMLVTKMALATSVALATLISAEAASAQPLRHQAAPEAYDTQANPNYVFGPRVT